MDSVTSSVSSIGAQISQMVVYYAPKLALAIITLFVGLWAIGIFCKAMAYLLEKRDFDASLKNWLVSIVGVLLKACLAISVISMVGVQTTSFIAILGAAGLAVGLALQGSLANFAGGVLLLIFKPFKVGDYIIAQGEEGIVDSIDVFCTFIITLDNQKVILPNGPLASEKMINVTNEPIRRVDLSVGVSYQDDVNHAEAALMAMAASDPRILQEPKPFIGVTGYGDSSVDLTVRVWCKTDDYWDVYFDTNKAIKPALDEAKISIPFPQRDVHMIAQ